MRTDFWAGLYLAFVAAVLGVLWLSRRRNHARLLAISERAAHLTPAVPAQRRHAAVEPRSVASTVYCSKEAIKEKIIEEYDASRTTVLQRVGLDDEKLKQIFALGRRVGQNDRQVASDE